MSDHIDWVKEIRRRIEWHTRYTLGKDPRQVSAGGTLRALSLAARDVAIDRLLETEARYVKNNVKRVYYLSMEFLMGQSLRNNLCNLQLLEPCRAALKEMGIDIASVLNSERDAALGNGGLGRLAACYLDSMASLGLPGFGYGINYEFGLFRQFIRNGEQHEKPDQWMLEGNPWQIERPDDACIIPLYGKVVDGSDMDGGYNPMWLDWKVIVGIPYDMPIVGYGGDCVNFLRLYSARASDDFDIQLFNEGDYVRAVEQKIATETISKVLYPSDAVAAGRELRLVQEYFFTACSIRDIVRRFESQNSNIEDLPNKVAIQLNDTHPALAVVELMRLLIDEKGLPWVTAWHIVQRTTSYTNHTLLPEALEKWSVELIGRVLPRHLQIIFEINARFLQEVSRIWPNDETRLGRMSLIEEGPSQQVRMANLSIVGSHAVNGVSELHSELVKTVLVPDFYEFEPEKFCNKTNGVTQRRFLLCCNPNLAELITATIGDRWIQNLDHLRELESVAECAEFQDSFQRVKRRNKERLAQIVGNVGSGALNPDSLFDVQAKRIHEYKRQLLNVLHIIDFYFRITEDGWTPPVPRTFIFAGKAAPGYWAAKQIIRLISAVGRVVNRNPATRDWMRVVFLPDYRVSLAEKLIPAADLSEQISTAGYEASGTGNMKFALNGALTIGTLDGANIEIGKEVRGENIYMFGLTAEQVADMRRNGSHRPTDGYHQDPRTRRVLDSLKSGLFQGGAGERFEWVFHNLVNHGDHYFHVADLPSYRDTQEVVGEEFRDHATWFRKAILNVARMGKFSSDRAIMEYAREIWGIEVCLPKQNGKKKVSVATV